MNHATNPIPNPGCLCIPLPRRYFTDPFYLIKDLLDAERVAARLKGLRPDWMANSEVRNEYHRRTEHRCPVCNNDTLERGEDVYIDIGHYQRVGPDHCETCGYVQRGGQENDPHFDPPTYQWLWELQIDPWRQL